MAEKSKQHTKWGSQPAYSVVDTAWFLNTGPANITSLLNLGIIKGIRLKSMCIPQFEIERFLKDNLGKDLEETIKEEQRKRDLEKQSKELVINA